MNISDLFDMPHLGQEIRDGYVTRRSHPEFPDLVIVNYTDRCQFDSHWNETTLRARGVIYNLTTGELIARGLPKFFNYGDETHTGRLDPNMVVLSAHDKIDGSLGIGYLRPDGKAAVATRGSFASEQAVHATTNLTATQKAHIRTAWEYGRTPLWEIVYPENRIVLDYGDRDELVYLGDVQNFEGGFYPARTSEHDFLELDRATLRHVLGLPPRKNAEGFVIWLNRTTAVKLKQDDYLALHRIVSSLTVKEVWRQLRDGTFDTFATALPDEFHDWVRATAGELVAEFESINAYAHELFDELTRKGLTSRKDQALWIAANVPPTIRGLLFAELDNKETAPAIWRMVEPKMEAPVMA